MNPGAEKWYRQPVLWFSVLIFIACIAGSVGMIVVAARYADEVLPVTGEALLKMPTTRSFSPPSLHP